MFSASGRACKNRGVYEPPTGLKDAVEVIYKNAQKNYEPGKKLTLYRGIQGERNQDADYQQGVLESWTDEYDVACAFARLDGMLTPDNHPGFVLEKEIDTRQIFMDARTAEYWPGIDEDGEPDDESYLFAECEYVILADKYFNP